jgi:hypothetical protein
VSGQIYSEASSRQVKTDLEIQWIRGWMGWVNRSGLEGEEKSNNLHLPRQNRCLLART